MNLSDAIEPTTFEHIKYVSEYLRADDLLEVQAATGRTPQEVLMASSMLSETIMTLMTPKGEPAAILGVVNYDNSGTGLVWLLGTPAIETHARTFLRHSRVVTSWLNTKYSVLFNYVDARNETHMRWLEWCGFTFIRQHPHHGVERRPFIEFVRIPDV